MKPTRIATSNRGGLGVLLGLGIALLLGAAPASAAPLFVETSKVAVDATAYPETSRCFTLELASGIYFVRLESGGEVSTARVVQLACRISRDSNWLEPTAPGVPLGAVVRIPSTRIPGGSGR